MQIIHQLGEKHEKPSRNSCSCASSLPRRERVPESGKLVQATAPPPIPQGSSVHLQPPWDDVEDLLTHCGQGRHSWCCRLSSNSSWTLRSLSARGLGSDSRGPATVPGDSGWPVRVPPSPALGAGHRKGKLGRTEWALGSPVGGGTLGLLPSTGHARAPGRGERPREPEAASFSREELRSAFCM